MANIFTHFMTWTRGTRVGEDALGNVYYQDRTQRAGSRRRRWVLYSDGIDDASRVPPQHHAWLHYTIDDFPSQSDAKPHVWIRDPEPNQTGTADAYRPPGHAYAGGKRDAATGDYEAWSPE